MPSSNFYMSDVFDAVLTSHGLWGSYVDGQYGGIFIPYYDDYADPGQTQINFESYNYDNRKDVPEFMYSLLNRVNTAYSSLTADEKPVNFRITKGVGVVDAENQTVTFTLTMNLNVVKQGAPDFTDESL
jgi:hypothetical protein